METKPSKPSREFPLFPHRNGQWAKKISGKLHYFGSWDDPEGALSRFEAKHLSDPAEPVPTSTNAISIPSRPMPKKPYADSPLFAHASGSWAKKIRGRLYYFGPWADPDAGLNQYLDQRDDLQAGRTPKPTNDGTTVRDVLNAFLNHKRRLVEAGDIVPRTFQDYKKVCERIAESIDRHRLVSNLHSQDFERLRAKLAKTRGPTALTNDITRIRTVFKYAYDSEMIDRPVRFGQSFKKPSKKTLRIAR